MTPSDKKRQDLLAEDPGMVHEYLMTRRRSFQIAQDRYDRLSAELNQLFEFTFARPEAAMTKFRHLVSKRGLRKACTKMESIPTRPVPGWKYLKGKVTVLHGPNRERERAQELLASLPRVYRAAEDARYKRDLAFDMLEEAKERQKWGQSQAQSQKQDEPLKNKRKRKLKQRR